jgi:hypothetical protein
VRVSCLGTSPQHLRRWKVSSPSRPCACLQFFNLDNVFATALLVLTLRALRLAFRVQDWAFVGVVFLGLPLAAFFMVYCGMPASVALCSLTGCRYRRCLGQRYDTWHAAWHVVSGLGKWLSPKALAGTSKLTTSRFPPVLSVPPRDGQRITLLLVPLA